MHKPSGFDKPDSFRMTVKCLVLDYDGTISPLNVSRTESEVPEKTRSVLHQISRLIPIVMVTTKDLSFVVPRTPFAHAWFAIGGLETRIGEKILKPRSFEHRLNDISQALDYARSHVVDTGVKIEEKRDSRGRAVAFCVDWRQAKDVEKANREVNGMAVYCEALSLELVRYEGQPFYDVYPVLVDKGAALETLRKELKLRHGVLFMGDSEIDNPAFETSDIGLGVIRDETPLQSLACDYFVRFEDVASLLSVLFADHLMFSSDFPMIKVNYARMRRL